MFRLLTVSVWMLFLAHQIADGSFRFSDDDSTVNNHELNRLKIVDWPIQTNNVDVDALSGSLESGNFSNHLPGSYEKRNNQHIKHPCSCQSKPLLEDFGDNVFPRYHASKVCDRENVAQNEGVCKFGSTCKEFYHKILLLKFKTNDMNQAQEKRDLPRQMRKDYFWASQEISIDCRCSF